MARSACIGLPRIGKNNVLPEAIDQFRHNKIDEQQLKDVAKQIRKENFQMQVDANIDIICSNDFTLADHVLDTSILTGNVPKRYYWEGGIVPLEIYFMMLYGQQLDKFDAHPMMLKCLPSRNYLYVVPEFNNPLEFLYSDNKAIMHYIEGMKMNIESRPIFFGPISYILLGNIANGSTIQYENIVEALIPTYKSLLSSMERLNIKAIQIDEIMLSTELGNDHQKLYKTFYTELAKYANNIEIHMTTGGGVIGNNLETIMAIPLTSIHINAYSNKVLLDNIISCIPSSMSLSLGLVDADNIWINDLQSSIALCEKVLTKLPSDRIIVSSTDSLFLCPIDRELENQTLREHPSWDYLAYGAQKLNEISTITSAINGVNIDDILKKNTKRIKVLNSHMENLDKKITAKAKKIFTADQHLARHSNIQTRRTKQLTLPILPITLIGKINVSENIIEHASTETISAATMDTIKDAITFQHNLNVDVVHHGEQERIDDIDYLASHMDGILLPEHAHVQYFSTITRRRPIIWDIPTISGHPYTPIAKYAMSITNKAYKISIMGPISFTNSCYKHDAIDFDSLYTYIAQEINTQALQLESIGVKIIHFNEEYIFQYITQRAITHITWLKKLINIFMIACRNLKDETQVHLYVAYIPSADQIDDLVHFDADVLMLNSARSKDLAIDSFMSYRYLGQIGFGLYDPYSARIQTKPEIMGTLKKITRILELNQIWMIPDGALGYANKKSIATVISNIADIVKSKKKQQ